MSLKRGGKFGATKLNFVAKKGACGRCDLQPKQVTLSL